MAQFIQLTWLHLWIDWVCWNSWGIGEKSVTSTHHLNIYIPWHPLKTAPAFVGSSGGLSSVVLRQCGVESMLAAVWQGNFKDREWRQHTKISDKSLGLGAQMRGTCWHGCLSTVSTVMPMFTQLLISKHHTLPITERQVRLTTKGEAQ